MRGNVVPRKRVILLATAMLPVIVASCWGKVIYVDDDANGLGNGSSWQNAYKYLQDALTDAGTAPKPVEVRVAQGVYKPDRTSARPNGTGDRNATFHLIDQVTLRGGFAGVGAVDPNARDVASHKSILSGDLAGNDVELTNPLAARDEPTRTDNCYHVVGANSPPTAVLIPFTAELDGFVIMEGQAFTHKLDSRVQAPSSHEGGGLHLVGLGSSGVSQLTVRECLFTHNYADECGGAIFSRFMGNLSLVDCTFTENGTYGWVGGGGLFDFRSNVQVTSCRFERNQARDLGGAIRVESGDSMTLTRCTLIGNVASRVGGGGIAVQSSPLKCLDCILKDNVAMKGGGGIYLSGGAASLVADRCHFTGNRAGAEGGAISNGLSSLDISNCLLSGNAAAKGGGVIWTTSANTHILNCTAHGNRSPKGNFLMDDTRSTFRSSAEIANCIVTDGENEVWVEHNPGAIVLRYTNIVGGRGAIHDPQGFATSWGPGNVDVDPCFTDPGHWDPNGTLDDPNDDFWVDGDYHLKSQGGRWDQVSGNWVKDKMTSECIDAGDPNSPVGEEPFPNGGRINMGAYGGTAEASRSYFGKPVCETIIVN